MNIPASGWLHEYYKLHAQISSLCNLKVCIQHLQCTHVYTIRWLLTTILLVLTNSGWGIKENAVAILTEAVTHVPFSIVTELYHVGSRILLSLKKSPKPLTEKKKKFELSEFWTLFPFKKSPKPLMKKKRNSTFGILDFNSL